MTEETVELLDEVMKSNRYTRKTNGFYNHVWQRGSYELHINLRVDGNGCLLVYRRETGKGMEAIFSATYHRAVDELEMTALLLAIDVIKEESLKRHFEKELKEREQAPALTG